MTTNEEASIYAESTSLRQVGDMVKMWDMTDFKNKSTADKFQSIKTLHEYDCKLQKSRVITHAMYSVNMGNGNALNTSNHAHDWLPARAGGMILPIWKTACEKISANA